MAAPALQVRFDPSELVRFRDRVELWAKDQLPFATAAALTDTAKDATSFVRNALVDTFTVRNPGFRNAIRYEPASKRDRPIEARVGVSEWASFLVFHALGGLKRARGGGRVAVPTSRVVRGATGRVPKRHKPRTLRDHSKLIQPVLDERGQIALRNRRGVQVFYHLKPGVRIKPRWPFHDQVEETVRARLGHHFRARMEQALATARPSRG